MDAVISNGAEPMTLPLDRVRCFPGQPREYFDEAELSSLARCIQIFGQLEPVLVKRVTDDPSIDWELVDGERRWRACKLAGLETITAFSTDWIKNRSNQYLASVIANFCRASHTPLEVCKSIITLLQAGFKMSDIAISMGKSITHVSQYYSLKDLCPEVMALLHPDMPKENRLVVSIAFLVARLPQHLQMAAVKAVNRKNMSMAMKRRTIEKLLEGNITTGRRNRRPSDHYMILRTAAQLVAEKALILEDHSTAELNRIFGGRSGEDFCEIRESIRIAIRRLQVFMVRTAHGIQTGTVARRVEENEETTPVRVPLNIDFEGVEGREENDAAVIDMIAAGG